jgi:hypothetical protein
MEYPVMHKLRQGERKLRNEAGGVGRKEEGKERRRRRRRRLRTLLVQFKVFAVYNGEVIGW